MCNCSSKKKLHMFLNYAKLHLNGQITIETKSAKKKKEHEFWPLITLGPGVDRDLQDLVRLGAA